MQLHQRGSFGDVATLQTERIFARATKLAEIRKYDRCLIVVACDRAIWVVWVRAVSRPSVGLVSCSDRTRSPLCSALLRFCAAAVLSNDAIKTQKCLCAVCACVTCHKLESVRQQAGKRLRSSY